MLPLNANLLLQYITSADAWNSPVSGAVRSAQCLAALFDNFNLEDGGGLRLGVLGFSVVICRGRDSARLSPSFGVIKTPKTKTHASRMTICPFAAQAAGILLQFLLPTQKGCLIKGIAPGILAVFTPGIPSQDPNHSNAHVFNTTLKQVFDLVSFGFMLHFGGQSLWEFARHTLNLGWLSATLARTALAEW